MKPDLKLFVRALSVLVVGVLLAGCAEKMEAEIGQCEPGIEDISSTSTVTPPGC